MEIMLFLATLVGIWTLSYGAGYIITKGLLFLWDYDPKAVLAERAKTWRDHSNDWQRRSS